ncbi:large subunit ribosomal protein L25 [Breznakibacter xylanolyticus]|uniref:Large ribosomal subunit protein bL25 n=1 Tax=Breznakibacter xylanolyticus TaxID=990 RepID=A0A2W7NAN7_9BACT|nr:50S ribosomal protein L25/general stress protein Ctc [Breznakibacter xylanolyticus]MBN2743551.1 50S ribosomal protein L25/general stress protein Ctc [Marinilabiliaceae bacterium]PZX17341.1 large subunit ribosomal protein L25 [Breznakibacter xylanolyticus]
MQTIELNGSLRANLGKSATKQLRTEEMVPCVLYGTEGNVHFSAPAKEFRHLIYTPNVYLVNLNIDGKTYSAIMQDIQFHPVSDAIQHVDFLSINNDKAITMEIPVTLSGFAEGVKAGGKLQLELRKLRVKALPKDMPDNLEIKIDSLGLGKTIQVKELAFDNIEILNAKNAVVVAVKLTRAARAAQQGK